jgi:EAL domain-containing protein (putative c-di-GMP-specific phosphodiesterase class I)
MNATPSHLARLLAPGALSTLFQPIVEDRGGRQELYAFECLTRGPEGSNFESADVLFDYARRKGAEAEIDRVCSALALAQCATSLDTRRISVNVHASTLGRDSAFVDDLTEMLARCDIEPARVIIEIIEHAPALNHRHFLDAVGSLRSRGFRIAIDDVGLGHSNFRMIVDCVPDYLKIDRYFITNVHNDARHAAVVDAVVAFAARLSVRVIAEGVEDAPAHRFLRGAGVELFQGYFYSRPLKPEDLREFIRTHPQRELECAL